MHARARLVTEIRRQARAAGKKAAYPILQQGKIADLRVAVRRVSETGVRVPCRSQRPRNGARHPGKMADGLDVLKASRIKGTGDNKFQLLGCHLMQEAARQPRRQLRCGHDLQAVLAITGGGRAAGGESQPTLNDNGPPHHHFRVPISGNNLIKEADPLRDMAQRSPQHWPRAKSRKRREPGGRLPPGPSSFARDPVPDAAPNA